MMKRSITRLLVLTAGLALAPPAHAQQNGAVAARPQPIVPGDVLLLQIAREDDLAVNLTVPDDGVIHFQRIGGIDVRGMTPDSLRSRLVREYARYLRDIDSRLRLEVHLKVRVTGAVQKPNSYTLHPTMTVADAVAVAGGALPDGRTDRVELRRDGQVVQVLLLADASSLAESPIQSGDQLHVPQRSFAARNLSVLVTAFTSVVAVAIALASK